MSLISPSMPLICRKHACALPGFRARLRARPCALSACDEAINDDYAEAFGTGIITQVVVIDPGRGCVL